MPKSIRWATAVSITSDVEMSSANLSEVTDSTGAPSPVSRSSSPSLGTYRYESPEPERAASPEELEPEFPSREEAEARDPHLPGRALVPLANHEDHAFIITELDQEFDRYMQAVSASLNGLAREILLLVVQSALFVLLYPQSAIGVCDHLEARVIEARDRHNQQKDRLELVWRRRNYGICRGKYLYLEEDYDDV